LVQGLSLDLGDLTALPARTAEAGIRLAAENQPDLILLSTDLPDRSGLDTLPDLREAARSAPVIVISTDWWTSNAATFIDQFMENPTNSLVMIQYAPSVPEFVKLTGEKGEAVLTQIISMTLPGERTDRIKEMYMDRYNEEPGLYAYHAYEQVYQYVDAVKKVGNPEDKLAVGKAIRTIERDTVIGHIKYDMDTHMPLAGPDYIPTVVIQVQNGELKILYPEKYAQAELMLPSYYEK
jgi:branched-chain amino acid transport system substrate-binding protein